MFSHLVMMRAARNRVKPIAVGFGLLESLKDIVYSFLL